MMVTKNQLSHQSKSVLKLGNLMLNTSSREAVTSVLALFLNDRNLSRTWGKTPSYAGLEKTYPEIRVQNQYSSLIFPLYYVELVMQERYRIRI